MTKKEIETLYKTLTVKINRHLTIYANSKLSNRKKFKILRMSIEKSIKSTYTNLSKGLFARLEKIANTKFLRTLYNSEKRSKINISKKIINKVNDIVKSVVHRKIASKTTKQRLKRNQKKILKQSIKIIKIEIKKGTSIPNIAKQLQLRLNIDKNKALRIARTESHRIREESTYKAYKEAEREGIRFSIKWLSTLDVRTRDTHQKLDGKYADEEGYFYSSGGRAKYPGGFGIAKEDIFCRCTTIQEFEELQGTNTRYVQETGKYIDYKTFEEWRNQ